MHISNENMMDIVDKFETLIKEGQFTKEQINTIRRLLIVWCSWEILGEQQREVENRVVEFSKFCDQI